MRILLLSPQPFYQVRGTPIAIDLLVSTLSKQGHHVDLLTYHEGEPRSYDNVEHFRIRAFGLLQGVQPGFSFKKLICSGLLFFKSIGLARKNRYDLVLANEEAVFIGSALKTLFKLPYVYDMDSSLSGQMVDKMPSLTFLASVMRKIEARAIRRATGVLAVCEALAKLARPYNSNVQLLTDVAMLDRLEPSDMITDLASEYPLSGTRFMYIGNLETYQGVDLMLEGFAMAHSPTLDISLIVIGGSDSAINHYRERAAALGVDRSVFFVGPRPFDDIAGYLAQADVLLSPRTKGENTPMKIYNYMASGKAMIATDIYSHTQVLDDRYAKLVEVTPESMARAMRELAVDPIEREALAKACQQHALKCYSTASFEDTAKQFFTELEYKLQQLSDS